MSKWRTELKAILKDMKPVEAIKFRRTRERLYIAYDELDTWRALIEKHGHINNLIGEINQSVWHLGGEMETIPEEAW